MNITEVTVGRYGSILASPFSHFPEKTIVLDRKNIDFGMAPDYNAEYWKIRCKANPLTEGRTTRGNPLWRSSLAFQIRSKELGNWNRNIGLPYIRRDTTSALTSDLFLCMREGIPFKTRSIRYDYVTNWVHVYDVPVLFYDIEKGIITKFTYNGKYNKFVSMVFRWVGIYVKLVKRKPTFIRRDSIPTGGIIITPIDIDEVYEPINSRGKFIRTLEAINPLVLHKWVEQCIDRQENEELSDEELDRRHPLEQRNTERPSLAPRRPGPRRQFSTREEPTDRTLVNIRERNDLFDPSPF